MQLTDIGANLTHDSFDADRAAVMARAAAAGVHRMIVTGATVEGSIAATGLAEAHPGVLFATAGVHPHHACDWDGKAAEQIARLQTRDAVVSGGECGLDYFRNFSSPAEQRRAFAAQLEIAADTGLPVFLHQRDAHDDFLGILKPQLPALGRAVAHCFTGTKRELRDYLDLGLYIGITGWICDERRGHHLRDVIHLIPPDRLMLETDAPYLLPRDLDPRPKSRRNEPFYLRHIAEIVAGCLDVPVEALARQTTATAQEFFGLPEIEPEPAGTTST